MTILSSPTSRRLGGILIVGLLLLIVATPVFGYNEENVDHIRLRRLDPVRCGASIRIVAYLTDEDVLPVRGATVNFSLLSAKKGDALQPKQTASDARGRALTTLSLSCKAGNRVVKASVPGDGSARLTVSFKARDDDKDGDHDKDRDGDHDKDRDGDHHDHRVL